MSKILIITCFFFLFITGAKTQICEGTQVVLSQGGICNSDSWVLAFEDNFDGISLDESKWIIPYQGVIRDYSFTNEKQWYTNSGVSPTLPISNNIIVNNGVAKLIAKKENPAINGSFTNWTTSPPSVQTSTFHYSSAQIQTKQLFGYGKYEIRCKIPKGKGFWPAFWTFGSTGWNEIDVFEFWNENSCFGNYDANRLSKNPHFNSHFDYDGDGDSENCGSDLYGPCDNWNGPDYSNDFHVFTMVWNNYKIEWYIDGVLKRTTTKFYSIHGQPLDCNSISANQPYILNKAFPQQEYQAIIANLAIQTGSNAPDSDTPFPSEFEIDYVRFYKQIPCQDINITANSQINLNDQNFNLIVGKSIVFSNNVNLSNKQLKLIARDFIEFNANVDIQTMNSFEAYIDPFVCFGKSGLAIPSNKEISLTEEYKSQLNDNDKLLIYPNPTNNLINIEFFESSNYTITLVDMNGNVLFKTDSYSNDIKIDMGDYSYGSYILEIRNNESKEIYRNIVVKQ